MFSVCKNNLEAFAFLFCHFVDRSSGMSRLQQIRALLFELSKTRVAEISSFGAVSSRAVTRIAQGEVE